MTARYVVGLDLSLTGTGRAAIDQWGATCVTYTSTGRRGDSYRQRRDRLRGLADDILDQIGHPALVVVEGPSVMSKGGSNWDRAGLWWLVVEPLIGYIPLAVAAPTVVKKWATNRGYADKGAVAGAMGRLWPEVETRNDNESDALALATMGAQWLGMDVPARAHHKQVLESVAWPEAVA